MSRQFKIVFLLSFLTVFIAGAIFLFSTTQKPADPDASPAPIADSGPKGFAYLLASPTAAAPDLTPVTFIIPKLNITTAIEAVGLAPNKEMDVPKNADNVAWYQHGTKPSDEGNAVIAGHFDTPTGAPAVFYDLQKLTVGDEIETISVNGVRSTFTVEEIQKIPFETFPNDLVFSKKPGKNLNIITCGGVWDRTTKNYSHRIVVFTSLKSVKT